MNNDISNVVNGTFVPVVRDISQQNIKANNVDKLEVNEIATDKNIVLEDKSNVISLDEAKKVAEAGNRILENVQRDLQFKVDDSTKQVVMSIIDKKTGDLIRQIPTEEALELAKRMQESAGNAGGLVSHKA